MLVAVLALRARIGKRFGLFLQVDGWQGNLSLADFHAATVQQFFQLANNVGPFTKVVVR